MIKLLLATTFVVTASSAYAATCADSAAIEQRLKERFEETLVSQSEIVNGRVFQVWMSDDTGTWTMIIKTEDGYSCLVGSGQNEYE